MPLIIPTLDDRKYQDLLNEAVARIPVHNPEWTNFNKSDPGITLIEIFAFLTENLLYRCNQIPERNRLKFLSLLGISLKSASSARGVVTFVNDHGPLQTLLLNAGLEVRAEQVPFRTENSLDVLPIEANAYYKRKMVEPGEEIKNYCSQLFGVSDPEPYETVPFSFSGISEFSFADTVDHALWIALTVRATDKPYADKIEEARNKVAGKTINLGIVPALTNDGRHLVPGDVVTGILPESLSYLIPQIPPSGGLPEPPATREAQYRPLTGSSTTDVLSEPGIVQITLPAATELKLWNNLDPDELGVGEFPPTLEDTNLNERLITWLKIQASANSKARLLWAGINAVFVSQRARIANELLPDGTGEPDQIAVLSKTPVVPGSLRLTVTEAGKSEVWQEIDDLACAGPEVPAPDLRQHPGISASVNTKIKVFTLNSESGEIRFGDGNHGKRPSSGSIIRADYDYGVGATGNVGIGSINSGPTLPAGLKVTNPVRTWGGAEAETVALGEKQIAHYLQHRDRLVNVEDFRSITLRTPGVDIGRVEVLPAFNPILSKNPGDAPGAVTLMIVPEYDQKNPEAPVPEPLFLDTICKYLEPRRLVTTEVFLRGPEYQSIWISVGINVVAGASIAQVREDVKKVLQAFLSPLPKSSNGLMEAQSTVQTTSLYSESHNGWPLKKPVMSRELLAVASRVPGVSSVVDEVLLAKDTGDILTQITITGIQLPQVKGIAVEVGKPFDIKKLREGYIVSGEEGEAAATAKRVPVPIIGEECK